MPPSPPRIASNVTQNGLMEGDTVQLNCTSSEGNPPPMITWFRNEIPLPPSSFTSSGPLVKFGTVLSVLVWRVTPSDHLANFTCSVRSNSSTSDLRTTEQLDVKCKYSGLSKILRYRDVIWGQGGICPSLIFVKPKFSESNLQ